MTLAPRHDEDDRAARPANRQCLEGTPEPAGLDLELELSVTGVVLSQPVFRERYRTAARQLAHMTVNGSALRTGDLYASGTAPGSAADQFGSGPGEGGGRVSRGEVAGRIGAPS